MIGIMGGTFDPIHYGHLQIAEAAVEQFDLKAVHFIPAYQPALKSSPSVSADQRAKWVKQAIKNNPHFVFDGREIERKGYSYTVDTLTSLGQEFPEEPLLFIMGVDAFSQFESWKGWQDILKMAHLLICNRPGSVFEKPKWSKPYWCAEPQSLALKKSGYLCFLALTATDISSTMIRTKVANKQSIQGLLPDAVYQEIIEQQIYLPPKRS